MTKIGTPASHRMISRNIGGTPLARKVGSAVASEDKPGGHRIVAVLPTTQGRPPSRAKPDNQAGRRHKPRKDRGLAGFVRRFARGRKGLVDPPLGVLLRHAGSLRHELREVGAILVR